MLWSKQYYAYDVHALAAVSTARPVAARRRAQRPQRDMVPHGRADDVISMPDKWEYPWYAAWDLAFHAVPLALVDPDFAKEQLS